MGKLGERFRCKTKIYLGSLRGTSSTLDWAKDGNTIIHHKDTNQH
ncbi:hypothetical protein MTR67_042042 [Solanum verrucosum]|uniref:Uncharacterized protein n=1 Tax=Solanum verrucosum TaxID=315347 RepID=A0AAF0UM29_SOLVR|nr:hypothetical protein MTR67_042042 [Solanum verrucosum]